MLPKMPIIILGCKGMLGQMVSSYFSWKGYEVVPINARFEPDQKQDFVNQIQSYSQAIVINCIGKIKQKTENLSELLWANSILPLELANSLLPQQILINPSTDCVFNGLDGKPYRVTDHPNATDYYGWSKRLGEVALLGRPNTLILRVSIIGPENSIEPKGLLGWFLSQSPGSQLKGFMNHFWNGITTLEWCKALESCLPENLELLKNQAKLLQLGTAEHYSKYEMLQIFQEIYQTNFIIEEFEAEQRLDRRLVPDIFSKSLLEQLEELKFLNLLA